MPKEKTVRKDTFEDSDFFDDCSVCQATKFAQEKGRMPTLRELKEAFRKAKEKGAIVGGKWFEEVPTEVEPP